MATRIEKSELGLGTIVMTFGVLWTLPGLWLVLASVFVAGAGRALVGAISAFLGLVIAVLGYHMSRKYICSGCGNRLEETSKLCPACHASIDVSEAR